MGSAARVKVARLRDFYQAGREVSASLKTELLYVSKAATEPSHGALSTTRCMYHAGAFAHLYLGSGMSGRLPYLDDEGEHGAWRASPRDVMQPALVNRALEGPPITELCTSKKPSSRWSHVGSFCSHKEQEVARELVQKKWFMG